MPSNIQQRPEHESQRLGAVPVAARATGRGVAFNGKFLSAGMTGVHRVAHNLLQSIDQLLAERPDLAMARPWEIIQPRNALVPLALSNIPRRTGGLFTWQPWEQFDLPRLAKGELLVNLCNHAPLSARGAITLVHDAQVFISPASYSRVFHAWWKFALPRIGAAAARILTVSEYSKHQLVACGVAPAAKIEVIHNGADHILRSPADVAVVGRLGLEKRRYALALANTQRHKNIAVLLRAMAIDGMADIRLVLVGGADAAAFVQQGMSPPANVVFAGSVSDAQMRGLMEHAACFAMPSTTEGFGLPPLEAMTVGCPVVAAPCGALPETCGAAATYVEPDDATGWARAMLRFTNDSPMHAEAAARGREHASRFTWRRAGQQLLDVIQGVLDAQTSQGSAC